jgi:hypothetical protein
MRIRVTTVTMPLLSPPSLPLHGYPRFRELNPGETPCMSQSGQQQEQRAERAKSRMSTAAVLIFAVVFGIIVLGIGLYLALR